MEPDGLQTFTGRKGVPFFILPCSRVELKVSNPHWHKSQSPLSRWAYKTTGGAVDPLVGHR